MRRAQAILRRSLMKLADVAKAAKHTIDGTSFDNNLLCIGEKALFVVESVADGTVRELTRNGGYLLNANELKAVERTVIKDGDVNKDFIGKDARVILDAARIRAPANTVAIVADVPADHTFIIDEYLKPILPVARMRNLDESLKGAVTAEGGRGHTAILHTNDMKRITQFNKAMDCNIVVVNAPSYACAGLGGEGFSGDDDSGSNRGRVYATSDFHATTSVDNCRRFVRAYTVISAFAPTSAGFLNGGSMELSDVNQVGVVGGGTMGFGIAINFALGGYSTVICDLNDEVLEWSMANIKSALNLFVEEELITQEQAKDTVG